MREDVARVAAWLAREVGQPGQLFDGEEVVEECDGPYWLARVAGAESGLMLQPGGTAVAVFDIGREYLLAARSERGVVFATYRPGGRVVKSGRLEGVEGAAAVRGGYALLHAVTSSL